MSNPGDFLPLDLKSLHLLIVLAEGVRHGYAIRQDVEERTDGAVRLWPATLYGTLADLTRKGLIDEAKSPAEEDDDPRRRYYAISPLGRRVLAAEAARLESLARLARARLTSSKAVT